MISNKRKASVQEVQVIDNDADYDDDVVYLGTKRPANTVQLQGQIITGKHTVDVKVTFTQGAHALAVADPRYCIYRGPDPQTEIGPFSHTVPFVPPLFTSEDASIACAQAMELGSEIPEDTSPDSEFFQPFIAAVTVLFCYERKLCYKQFAKLTPSRIRQFLEEYMILGLSVKEIIHEDLADHLDFHHVPAAVNKFRKQRLLYDMTREEKRLAKAQLKQNINIVDPSIFHCDSQDEQPCCTLCIDDIDRSTIPLGCRNKQCQAVFHAGCMKDLIKFKTRHAFRNMVPFELTCPACTAQVSSFYDVIPRDDIFSHKQLGI